MPPVAPARPRRWTASVLGVLAFALAGADAADAATGHIFTEAGTGTAGYSGDGGPAADAQLSLPVNVVGLADGGYLIVDQGAPSIRRVSPAGIITTVAGDGTAGPPNDGGPATSGHFSAPNGVIQMPYGRILVADSNHNRVRQVGLDGNITTVVGNGAA